MSIRRRIVGFLLALALMFQLLPVMPLAVRAETDDLSYITVNGQVIVSGKYMAAETNQVSDTKPESGGYLYYEDGYLLLDNFTFSSNNYNTIVSEAALTIELVGENTLVGNYMYAIRHTTEEPLVIQGTGSLTVSGRSGGISAYGGVTINANVSASANGSYDSAIGCNGDLYIQGGVVYATNASGRGVSCGNLYMNGGALEATGKTRGISTKILEINGGDLTAISTDTASDSSNYAIQLGQNLPEHYIHNNINASILAATEPDGTPSVADFSSWKTYDYVRIYDPGVEVDGVKLSSGEYLSQGSSTPATTKPSGSYAYYDGGVLTLQDFAGGSIHGGNLTLNLQGESRLSGNLKLDDSLCIVGTGSLEINVSGQEPAMQVGGKMTMESGNLSVTNQQGLGLSSGDTLTVTGGALTVNGGAYCDSVCVDGGNCRFSSQSDQPALRVLVGDGFVYSVSLYSGSLELSSQQTHALVGYLYMVAGDFFAETGAEGCRVITENLMKDYQSGYEYLCADKPGGELVPCNANEMGQFSRIRIGVHHCAPVLVEQINPTCGDSGKLAYYRCSCGKYYEDAAATILINNIYEYGNLDPLGHDSQDAEYAFDENWHYKFCKACGAMDLTTYDSHYFVNDLYCICGATRQANLTGVISYQIRGTITVRLWRGDILISEYETYDKDHHFSAYYIEPGIYTLEVEVNGYEPYRGEIVVDQLNVEHNVVLQPKVNTISGSVSSDMGWTDPATVNLYQNGVLMHTVTTQSDFTLKNVLTGIYTLEIIKKDHEYVCDEVEINGSGDGWHFLLDVLRGDITGTVNCESHATGYANFELYYNGELAGMVSEDPNGGAFNLLRYPVGQYILKVRVNGHKTLEIPVNLTTAGVHLDIQMEALKADVSVTVYSYGSETQEITIRVFAGQTMVRDYTVAGNEVTCVLEALPVGDYEVIVAKAGHYTQFVQLKVTEQGGFMSVPLQPIRGEVDGYITTSDDVAVNATVQLLQDGEVVKSTRSTGYFCFKNLVLGNYTLRISMDGYEPAELELEITEGYQCLDVQLQKTASEGRKVSGTITTFITEGDVKVELLQDGTVIFTAVVTGTKADFTIEGVEDGTYTMRVSKENHVTVELIVVLGDEPLDLDLKLCPKGDATGDGVVNAKDYQRLLRHINKSSLLTDYAYDCGDITGDGVVNAKDFARLLRHINKTNPLF